MSFTHNGVLLWCNTLVRERASDTNNNRVLLLHHYFIIKSLITVLEVTAIGKGLAG